MLLPPFQIISRFGFSRYITLIYTMSRYIIKTMYLEKPKRLTIWNKANNRMSRIIAPLLYDYNYYTEMGVL